jgi:hypothetical protein
MAKTTDPLPLKWLAEAVAALAGRMSGPEAARLVAAAARPALAAMTKTTDPDNRTLLGQSLVPLLKSPATDDTSRRTSAVVAAIGSASHLPGSLAVLPPLTEAARRLPGRCTEQQLVDMLKMPICREARKLILEQLSQQCDRTFAHQWQLVEWAQQHRPDLDLTSPPVRPKP